MKKTILCFIAAALALSMTACTSNDTPDTNDTTDDTVIENTDGEANVDTDTDTDTDSETEADTETENDSETETDTDTETDPEAEVDGEPAGASVGETLTQVFKDSLSDGATAEEIANKIVENGSLPFSAGAMVVEEGLLVGFDNAEITGFEDGAVFMPMIGSIPFVGYVFNLADGADVEAFKTTLTDNANPRWNICVTAEETVCVNEGNTVFFLMCPASFEEAPAEDAGMAL